MKITAKGQVTIPKALREKYRLFPDTEVEFEPTDRGVVVRLAGSCNAQLRNLIDQAVGCATIPISTDEIFAITRGDG